MPVAGESVVSIVDGPLGPHVPGPAEAGAGAALLFEGIVRGDEAGRPIEALDYEVYEPMASRELGLLIGELLGGEGILAIRAWHSRGRVPVGAVSFRLLVASVHRKEGLRAMDAFIDRMKRDVPIWKRAVVAGA